MLVRFNNVRKAYGSFQVLEEVSLTINAGDKLGLIGANGTGKTTLLHLIETPEETDGGTIDRSAGLRIGRLEQHPEFTSATVLDEALESFAHTLALERELRELEHQMQLDQVQELLERYANLQHRFEDRGGYSCRARTEAALFGLGFQREQFGQVASTLSGGEKNRLALARLLLTESDLILLDEPTNHLDIRTIEWLEYFLSTTATALLVVSHDRLFLDRVVSGVLELDRGKLHQYRGNYTAYVQQRDARVARMEKDWKKQQEWISETEEFIRRNLAGQKTRQAQSRRKVLEKLDRLERPVDAPPRVRFRFGQTRRSSRLALQATNLVIGHDVASQLTPPISIAVERGHRWAILGPNGSGKTTLLTTLTGKLRPLAGELDRYETEIGYYDQELGGLHADGTVLDEVRSLDGVVPDEELRNFLAGFQFRGEAIHKQVRDLSGGEKSRLALAKLIYRTPPLLALDEPTNHLDITSREALEAALIEYPGTLLMVTHDRRLVERVASHILYLDADAVSSFDSFMQFEAWLSRDIGTAPEPSAPPDPLPQTSTPPRKPGKNRQEQLRKQIERLEASIGSAEHTIHAIEAMFQQPPADFDWASTNRQYSDLKEQVEDLYRELARRLDEQH